MNSTVLYQLEFPYSHQSMVDRFEAIQNTLCARFIRSENFATQSREENIWSFWPRKADSSPCVVNVWIVALSQINQLANEIGILAHVISKLKMAETTLLSAWNHAGEIIFVSCLVMKGETMARTVLNDSLSNRWNCLNASWSLRKRFGYAPCCWLLKIHSLQPMSFCA